QSVGGGRSRQFDRSKSGNPADERVLRAEGSCSALHRDQFWLLHVGDAAFPLHHLRDGAAERLCKWNRDRIADLTGDFDLGTAPDEIVVKPLKPARLKVRYGTICLRVEITALLGLEELGPHRDGGAIPPQPAKDVRAAGRFLEPTAGRQVRTRPLEVEPIASRGDRPVSLDRLRTWRPCKVQVSRANRPLPLGVTT